MKIAFFTDTFLPQVNGIATSLANQAQQLSDDGHQVIIFTPKLDDIQRGKFQAKNVEQIPLPTVPALLYPEYKLGILGLPKVLKHLRKFNPDVIHLHTPLTIGLDAVMASKILKKPLVGTVHIYFTQSEYLRGIKYNLVVKTLGKISQPFVNFLYGQCDLILVPSRNLIEELKQSSFAKKLIYFPNGVKIKQPKILLKSQKDLLKKEYHLKEKVILHLGRLSKEKNIDVLIKAFGKICQKYSNVSLLIVGDGPETDKLKVQAKKLNLEKSIVFTGFIEHQKLLSSGLISVGDIFATASTAENQPMAILEAMMFGLPVIGVKHAGLTELISSNGYTVEAGHVEELSHALEKVLFNQALSRKMGKNSLKLVKQYSVKKTSGDLIKLYKQSLQALLTIN